MKKQCPDFFQFDEGTHFRRISAESVSHFLLQKINFFNRRTGFKAFIEFNFLLLICNIGFRDKYAGFHEQGGAETVQRLFSLERTHCIFQHLTVKIKPDIHDISGLLAADNIAGTPDFHILHGDFETVPQAAYSAITCRRFWAVSLSATCLG
jgi:hypothetical protein